MAGITGSEFGVSINVPYGDFTGTGYDRYVDTTGDIANAQMAPIYFKYFSRIRVVTNTSSHVDIGNVYPNRDSPATHKWVQYIKSNYPNVVVHYGCASENSNPVNWTLYKAFILADAASMNGVLGANDIYSVGNENLISNKHSSATLAITSLSRSSNVATATVASVGDLVTGDKIYVTGATSASTFNVADDDNAGTEAGVVATVVDGTHFTFPSTGVDETASAPGRWNWTAYEVTRKTKQLAVLGRAAAPGIAKWAYTESQGHMGSWNVLGITPGSDLDFMGVNTYGAGGGNEADFLSWKSEVDTDFAVHGASKMIITEFNVVQDGGNKRIRGFHNNHSFAEVVFDEEMMRRYKYLKALGITQIYLFNTGEYSITRVRDSYYQASGGANYDQAYWTPKFKPLIHRMVYGEIDSVNMGLNT